MMMTVPEMEILKTTPIPVKFDRQGHSCNFYVGFGPTSSSAARLTAEACWHYRQRLASATKQKILTLSVRIHQRSPRVVLLSIVACWTSLSSKIDEITLMRPIHGNL